MVPSYMLLQGGQNNTLL